MELTREKINQIIKEIGDSSERDRRAEMLKRHAMYKDGGKQFLLEQVRKEFNEDAVNEFRMAPINVIKKIINLKSQCYKKSPIRKAEEESDQALVDYYVDALSLNSKMQKANRFYNLFANCELMVRFEEELEDSGVGNLCLDIVAPYQYSLVSNPYNMNKIDAKIFSAFADQNQLNSKSEAPPPTGKELSNPNKSSHSQGQLVSQDGVKSSKEYIRYMMWTDENYYTTNFKGEIVHSLDDKGSNPIGIIPSVTLAKDRDNETYSTVGNDLPDLSLVLQMGWSDLLSIAKHQGFSLLTMTGPSAPTKMIMGLNRVLWMKQEMDQPTPTVSYVTANSPLAQYKDLLVEVLAMLLSSNDLNPQSVGGTFSSGSSATSGFHALINSSDTIEAINMDKPVMKDAEESFWNIIKKYHNYLHDAKQLSDKARALGKFSDDFEINLKFSEVTPLMSEKEIMENVTGQIALGLLSKKQALQKLNPDFSKEQIEALMEEIQLERDDSNNNSAKKMLEFMKPNGQLEE